MDQQTPPASRQPWEAPRLVEQPVVNDATSSGGPNFDATFAPTTS